MFVVVAQWYAKAGADDEIAEVLKTAIRNSRAEPGCVLFMANRSVDDPRKFVLYEQFADRRPSTRTWPPTPSRKTSSAASCRCSSRACARSASSSSRKGYKGYPLIKVCLSQFSVVQPAEYAQCPPPNVQAVVVLA